MTTHELAAMLVHLRDAFGPNLKADAAKAMTEAADAFQSLPAKPIRDVVKELEKAGAGPEALVQRILAAKQSGNGEAEAVLKAVNKLKSPELKAVLTALHLPTTGKVAEQKVAISAFIGGRDGTGPELNGDHEAIETAYRLYRQLSDSRMTIEELRERFRPLSEAKRPVLAGVAAKIGYRTDGSREDIAHRLLMALEGLCATQVKNELIGAAH
jgi:hypothetical protein